MKHVFFFVAFCLLSACATAPAPDDSTPLLLGKSSFSALSGWADDDAAAAAQAFAKSCERILKRDPADKFGPVGGLYGDWHIPCKTLFETPAVLADARAARAYFETWFQPWEATAGGRDDGLFTGYYESALMGSRVRGGVYQTPLRKRPNDLVMVDLGEFRESLKGQRIAGRVRDGHLKPFEDHRAIAAGKLNNDADLALVWVDDPVDAFFVQIQGSGVVQLNDGTVMRIGYDGQNGHVYYAVGRELIKRGVLAKEDVSMQSIRAWMDANPEAAAEVMYTNPSYVFFKELTGAGPLGGENVALSPGRSLAIDRAKIAYGIPLWVDIEHPDDAAPPLRRMMIAQDTGGAIRGAVRGDVFWGYGAEAERLAGMMKSRGWYWLLLPKTVARP